MRIDLIGRSNLAEPVPLSEHQGVAMNDRERTVLSLIAEGRSNRAIAKQLFLSPRAIERDVQAIFQKLGLVETEDDNRRVLAVLALLGR